MPTNIIIYLEYIRLIHKLLILLLIHTILLNLRHNGKCILVLIALELILILKLVLVLIILEIILIILELILIRELVLLYIIIHRLLLILIHFINIFTHVIHTSILRLALDLKQIICILKELAFLLLLILCNITHLKYIIARHILI